ncbi:type II toxin-antitoxin system VapC family toxin [Jiangella rhizosphaerae]|uniref:Ribonuclease VapC n=1 Tax=Jiangella rhizosphaerae TaxID=2293569 RepID=A0A418KKN2_9ACTN|nr:type II toxin-antitoxin system VapC family toxin [Jiangella rhizosphaerae]RIQ16194.1 PIN domain-containing protein [Jiangella rhizosphaerae]
MIGYLDTSAFVPLLVGEPTSESCRRFWDDSDVVVSSRLLYVETAAALAQARRLGRLTEDALDASLGLLDELWLEIDVVEVDDIVVERAAVLARRLELRGYDAVHCASAERLNEDDLVAATGDRKLIDAWGEVGVATFDTNNP